MHNRFKKKSELRAVKVKKSKEPTLKDLKYDQRARERLHPQTELLKYTSPGSPLLLPHANFLTR